MQNSDFRTRITSLNGFQTSPMVFFSFKTATLAPEVLVSMGPSPHLRFLQAKKRLLDQNYKSQLFPDFACWFVNAKQHVLIQNDACLLFPSFICSFVLSKQGFSIRKTGLFGTQPSFVIFACITASLAPELQVSMVPSPHLWVLHAKQRL